MTIQAADGIRTHDLVLTKDALYQLSHSSINGLCPRDNTEQSPGILSPCAHIRAQTARSLLPMPDTACGANEEEYRNTYQISNRKIINRCKNTTGTEIVA